MNTHDLITLLNRVPDFAKDWPVWININANEFPLSGLLLFPPGYCDTAQPDGYVALCSFIQPATGQIAPGVFRADQPGEPCFGEGGAK